MDLSDDKLCKIDQEFETILEDVTGGMVLSYVGFFKFK